MKKDSTAALLAVERLLKIRPRSVCEVSDRLRRKGFSKDLIGATVAELGERGYLNDEAFARWWVSKRAIIKPSGERLLWQELVFRFRVDRTITKSVLSEFRDAADEVGLARKALGGRLDRFKKLSFDERRKKIRDFLLRRGFSFQAISAILKEV